jgi:hypothetical protein
MCPINDLYTLCTLPPLCILFEPSFETVASFPGMNSTAIPVFCCRGSVKINNMVVTRHQVPITPAWAITDYKVQGLTCEAVTLDLHRQNMNSNSKATSSHRIYCSCYVQLSRVRSLQDLFLLQPVSLADLNCKPNKMLTLEDERIATLASKTDLAWMAIEGGSDF